MRSVVFGMCLLAAVVAGCGDAVDLPIPSQLAVVAETDAQSAPAGARLARPLEVRALDDNGLPVPRATVRWQMTAGEGAVLSDSVTVSDGTGRAEVSLTLGPATGSYAVRASLGIRPDRAASFTATATPPPALSAVVPATFTGGDTVVLQGSALSGGFVVEIGGAPAGVVSATPAGDQLTAVVPICLVPGSVDVRVLFDGGGSNTVTGAYQASGAPVVLAVGEYASLEPARLDGCATFPAAGGAGAEYLLTPQATTGVPGLSAAYRLQGDSVSVVVAPPPPAAGELPFAVRFHDRLRAWEREFAALPGAALEPGGEPLLAAGIEVGHRRQFGVCNKVTCGQDADFTRVTAVAMYVGEHAAIYQDVGAPSGGLTDQDFSQLGLLFDQALYEVATRAFGSESDVDRNGILYILITPVVNGLTPTGECQTSVITAFTFAADIDPAFRDDPRSNQAEVFYTLAPDPQGTVTCTISVDQFRGSVPVTFVHELQHMISYYQHVLVRNGPSEALWLNEALSHLSEELAALHFQAQGDDQRFSQFAIGDVVDAYRYLEAPESHFVVFSEGTGTLPERGAAWLFARWLVDQFGETVPRRLVETRLTGAANVEAVTGEPFSRLAAQWFLTNWVSDLPDFEAPPRLRYGTWRFRTTYQSLHDQRSDLFPRPFPIEPQVFNGGEFQVDGTLRAGSGAYLRVVQSAGQRGFTVRLEHPAGGPVNSAVAPRLNVIRIR